jgi:hypothetical protein
MNRKKAMNLNIRKRDDDSPLGLDEYLIDGYVYKRDELDAAVERAKALASGLSLVSSETKVWYEDTYEVAVENWRSIAVLLDRHGRELKRWDSAPVGSGQATCLCGNQIVSGTGIQHELPTTAD